MGNARMNLGKLGEEIAGEYLADLGHTIVERNWRSGHYEIDLITVDPEGLHFVEVKSRVAPVSASPEENVDFRKQQKLVRAANLFLHSDSKKRRIGDMEIFFDVISVIFEGERTDITFFPKAYVPIYC